MDNSKLRHIIIFILIGLCSNYSKAETNDFPDIDSVCNAISQGYIKKTLNLDRRVIHKFMITAVHLSIEDFCGTESDTTSMGNVPVFIENNPIYTNYWRIPLKDLYKENYMWEAVRNVYGAYTRSIMKYFKSPRFVVSLKSSIKGNCLSLTVSLENFKVLDKYTAYIYNIAYYNDSVKFEVVQAWLSR